MQTVGSNLQACRGLYLCVAKRAINAPLVWSDAVSNSGGCPPKLLSSLACCKECVDNLPPLDGVKNLTKWELKAENAELKAFNPRLNSKVSVLEACRHQCHH
jgi:hypothetical protein